MKCKMSPIRRFHQIKAAATMTFRPKKALSLSPNIGQKLSFCKNVEKKPGLPAVLCERKGNAIRCSFTENRRE